LGRAGLLLLGLFVGEAAGGFFGIQLFEYLINIESSSGVCLLVEA
jgi:hypothetical protein